MRNNTETIARFGDRTMFSAGLATALARFVRQSLERIRQRHQLASFDDRLLRDIGISRRDVVAEAAKPFWRV